MLIVNADDYGRTRIETDVTLKCYGENRITSATAMVYMADSVRAAELAQSSSIDLGLHLNLSQPFTGQVSGAPLLKDYHNRVIRFIASNKYSRCIYHPALRREFQYVYQSQLDEFTKLYGRHPSHIDGHHHAHLCSNMLLDKIIPAQERVRRSFSFLPGEKSEINRVYRRLVDLSLARRYRLTDFFFSLQHCLHHNAVMRVYDLSRVAIVELMTHPADHVEYSYLMSRGYASALHDLNKGTYASL